ncbi:MAG: tetratricopeptide repeat protein [Terracidiphilus sp.]|nr:tetratricopeptide repeat protein [Terracidiphilus sp.]
MLLPLLLLIGSQTVPDAAATFQRAQALATAGHYEQAAVEFRKVAEAQPRNTRAWYALGRTWVAAASEAYGRLLDQASQDSPYAAAIKADALMRRLQYPRAIAGFRAALSREPNLASARTALAEMYSKLGRQDWANQERAANAALDCVRLPLQCAFLTGRFEAILATTAEEPTESSLYWRGQAATGLANQAFQRLEQLPPSVELHKYRAGLDWEADRRLDVVKDLRAAVQLAPRDRGLREELASALGAAGFFDEACEIAHALLRGAPDSPQLNALAGTALLSAQNAEDAIPFLKKAVALEPRDLNAQATLARAYMQTGEIELALPYLKAAAPTDSDGSLHHLLATAYRRTGQRELADEAMAKYQELAARSAAPPFQTEITPP